MEITNYSEYFISKNIIKDISYKSRYKLIIILGCLADFDSFEYIQAINKFINEANPKELFCTVIAIGSEKSKNQFCNYTDLSRDQLIIMNSNKIHLDLDLVSGLSLDLPAIFNLLLMCSGLNSPGTLKEVLRGYSGDRSSSNIFDINNDIKIPFIPQLNSSLFKILGNEQTLRPFELATRRLLNMIEILSHWRIYAPYPEYLTQRGGTFLFGEHNQLLYSYRPLGLLGFASNMSKPLDFLDRFID
tara:strand:+ start:283 stop:1017 length:735 start_codon:yes stop_codon:yes gene_type:complete